MNYRDKLKELLAEQEWAQESSLTSLAVREKYGVSKASGKKQKSALGALKIGHKEGIFKKGIRNDGKIFWGIGTGEKEQTVLLGSDDTYENANESTLLNTARKNIKSLEEALQNICAETLQKAYGDEWEKYLDPKTIEKIASQYWKDKRSSWKSGGAVTDFLSVAGIRDISHIVGYRENWELFQSRFGNKNRFIVLGKLAELGDYRNKIQHNAALSKDEYLFFNIASQLLLRDIT
ncbi:MAG: hypothetical protein A2945_01400 [Candidatus Liptonbacteria bacterium RIFCSPLOWO2_01_FULL_52_25]|uniref:Swt1-like HEPN domain-containing protein n=1 Tax=Candidatus Liptonbacteria bacterium RIFCSPLOWO2_01_FULL_52_25 TaxID=1798650 RepID=A0A1G2CDN9_9BACT|nr:MAG: hypothetical protein A2945_01400 [Candidatus Liptonbacteria bacterium RIFCSPLOWO2_01_FULL_52_25]OHB23383.1 MAG: hypothetical protein A3J67_02860 [Parcubacteria group bacterium RIFCSPHIGHO2_02_FULL_48_10b]